MRSGFALAILLLSGLAATPVVAGPVAELKLIAEHPVDGMRGGNLSGLAMCRDGLWAVSDRDDDRIYRLDTSSDVWKAEKYGLDVPPVPDSGLPWGLRSRTKAASFIRGGDLDFEGISCDSVGNRYIVSESHAAVLRVPFSGDYGDTEWLKIAPSMVREARASGMLLHFNALFEGLAVNPEGNQIWLAAERERRGLISIKRPQSVWDCDGACVLLSEAGQRMQPAQFPGAKAVSKDFADLALFNGKLFTLERNAFQICRRDTITAQVEMCWSYAEDSLVPNRRYPQAYGLAEALVIDADGAWMGIDNNFGPRVDGEKRPMVYRFAAPAGGWSAKP
ncbi:DNA topoisomerase IV [Pseudomonas sp. CCM 7891]|uniref:DNA topoisomerase IV n=1 Tax=Pseudomonas karstica TaxID=1055468 RepID=A0A7X2UXQ2_9PSED|nr:esterase-like activity of phytase family protein [Pseudomonas karstica]MTD18658.1 DNA topoisomerase IV [Pseudomonas karstica]